MMSIYLPIAEMPVNALLILLMSGGHGVGNLAEVAARILVIPGNHQILAMAGRNADLLARAANLRRLLKPSTALEAEDGE